jgi:hypothetical protein
VTLHRPLRFLSGHLTLVLNWETVSPEGFACFKRVPLRLNKLGDDKKSHILASSVSRPAEAAEAAASSADQLRAEAHTFVQGTAEHVIKQNSGLRAKIKEGEAKLEVALAS